MDGNAVPAGFASNQMLMPMIQMLWGQVADAQIRVQSSEASLRIAEDQAKRYAEEARQANERALIAEATTRRAKEEALRASQRDEDQAERLKRQEKKHAEDLAHEQEMRRTLERQLLERCADAEQRAKRAEQRALETEAQVDRIKRELNAEREKRSAQESQLGKSEQLAANLLGRVESVERRLDDTMHVESVKLDRVEALEDKLSSNNLSSLRSMPFVERITFASKFQYHTPPVEVLPSRQQAKGADGAKPLLRPQLC